MINPTLAEILTAEDVLATAADLMGVENAAQQAAREKDPSVLDYFVSRRAPDVPPGEAHMLRRLGRYAKHGMTVISGLTLSDAGLFRALFGLDLPPGAEISKKPYVIQWFLRGTDYEQTCLAAGLNPSYAESDGLCMAPGNIRHRIGNTFGNAVSVTIVRATKETDPLLERHEELHGYQRMLAASGYIPDTTTLERDLFKEEAADCIPEAEMGTTRERTRLVRTAYFSEHGLREGKENMPVLAKKITPNKPAYTKRLVTQRERNEYALNKAYQSGNTEFKKLAGWAIHLVDFYRAHRIIPAMQAVYETT